MKDDELRERIANMPIFMRTQRVIYLEEVLLALLARIEKLEERMERVK